MARTLINLGPDDKAWLDRDTQARNLPMTELVHQAVRGYRTRHESRGLTDLQAALHRTAGIWERTRDFRMGDKVEVLVPYRV